MLLLRNLPRRGTTTVIVTAAVALQILATHTTAAPTEQPLHEVFGGSFRVGVAVGTDALTAPDAGRLRNASLHYNSVTPENLLKWESVHPSDGQFDFSPADRFVEFGEQNGMQLIGHTLVWHSQTPSWVFQGSDGEPATRDALIERMRQHIERVVGRYRGRINGWDVVNEALNDDGTLRDSPWRRIIGDEYLELAFRFAEEADPNAELYYNDYNLHLPAKREGAVRIAERLKRAGCRIDAIGMQGHWGMDYPSDEQIDDSVTAFAKATGRVMITELDINVLPRPDGVVGAEVSQSAAAAAAMDPYKQGLPPAMQDALAQRYAELFRAFLRHKEAITRVTFWGTDDGVTWHNDWPIPGRTAHSLLFDRDLRPKPAFDAVRQTVIESH